MEREFPGGRKLRLVIGDITRLPVDAIVNAANSALAGGGGVDGAIHRAGGPQIMLELGFVRASAGGCPTGNAVATTAGRLPARYVFHAVGPVYRDGRHGEPELLASCYRTCLRLGEDRSVTTISFPSISTGAYRYPVEAAAGIALRVVSEHLAGESGGIREVVFVLFDQATFDAYSKALGSAEPRP